MYLPKETIAFVIVLLGFGLALFAHKKNNLKNE
jgi:hypothetical protein